MRNREEFESLVFERAEKIKARDRAAKTIRLSIMPIAAAFLVLTAVGIHRLTSMNANLSDAAAPADAANAAEGASFAAPDYTKQNEEYSEKNISDELAPQDIAGSTANNARAGEYEDYAAEDADNGAAKSDEVSSEAKSERGVTVTFSANDPVTLVGEPAGELADALAGESTPSEDGSRGYIGRITVEEGGTDTDYYLYPDHVRKAENGSTSGSYALSDTTKALIEKYFSVRF